MATNNYNKIFGVKRTIWSSESFYTQDDDVKEQYKRDIMEQYDIDDEEELTEEKLAQYWYEDNEFNYDCERDNLGKDIDGCIIALARRSSNYGAICGNGREATKVVGYSIAGILETTADDADWWAEDYNIEGRLSDHDGSWYVTYRVCKDYSEAERLQDMAYEGKLDNADIMARTKSLYPYIAKIYGWPYRGSKKAA
jgi:hypothetical protein